MTNTEQITQDFRKKFGLCDDKKCKGGCDGYQMSKYIEKLLKSQKQQILDAVEKLKHGEGGCNDEGCHADIALETLKKIIKNI